jgi:hypothetical protein
LEIYFSGTLDSMSRSNPTKFVHKYISHQTDFVEVVLCKNQTIIIMQNNNTSNTFNLLLVDDVNILDIVIKITKLLFVF